MSTLPTEIVDHILSLFDVLSPSQYDDLKACADAHPFLLKSAERYLFSYIRVHRYPTVGRVFNFSHLGDVLLDKPHIANYVCAFGVNLTDYRDLVSGSENHLVDMLFIMSKLRRLKAIEISGHSNMIYIPWLTLPNPFREAFINWLGLPSVKKVSIIRMDDFPMTAFGQCKGLLELSLDGSFAFLTSSAEPCPQLESLSIYNWLHMFPGILTWARALNLRRLDICVPNKVAMLSDLIRMCSAITELELDFLSNYTAHRFSDPVSLSDNLVSGLALSPLTNLEHLTIHTSLMVHPDNITIATCLSAIVQVLGTASVKNLSLHLHYRLNTLDIFSDVHWSHLKLFSTFPTIQHTNLLLSGQIGHRILHPSEIMSLRVNATVWTLMNRGITIKGAIHKCRHSRCWCYQG